MRKQLITALLTLGILTAGSAYADRYALLVGAEDYPHLERNAGMTVGLPGPSNDVKYMASLLENRYQVKPSNMKILMNEKAVHDPIKAGVNWLAESVKPGDVALFFYSGHGSSLPDQNNDESDGKDEALVCNDYDPQNAALSQFILDDELSQWFGKIRAKGAELVFVADCCHAGTIARDFVKVSYNKYLTPSDSLVRRMGGWHTGQSRAFRKEASQDDDSGVTLIAACLDEQTSATYTFPKVNWMGALTYNLVSYLSSAPSNPSYKELASKLQKSITVSFSQIPQVSGSDLSEGFFDSKGGAPAAAPVTTPEPPAPAIPPTSSGDKLYVLVQNFGSETASIEAAIKSTGYALPASTASQADRILVKKNASQVNFDLRDGTVEESVNASGSLTLIKKLRPNLLRAFVQKKLTSIQNEDTTLSPEVAIETTQQKNISVRPTAYQPTGTQVKIGTKTIFKVKVAQPCYVTLIDLPTEGALTVLLPNKYNPGNLKIDAGQWVSIPSAEMGFDITAEGPAGRDIVIAIASRKPIDLSSLNLSEVDQSGISASRDLEAGARLFRVAAKPGAEDPISAPSSVLPSDGYAIAYVVAEVTN